MHQFLVNYGSDTLIQTVEKNSRKFCHQLQYTCSVRLVTLVVVDWVLDAPPPLPLLFCIQRYNFFVKNSFGGVCEKNHELKYNT